MSGCLHESPSVDGFCDHNGAMGPSDEAGDASAGEGGLWPSIRMRDGGRRMTYLALLRGINVGGKRKVSMDALAEVFAESGCTDVETFIQSGNVLFDSAKSSPQELSAVLESGIEKRFGFPVPVVLRTKEQLRLVLCDNPFRVSDDDDSPLHVLFLKGVPPPENAGRLDPERSDRDAFVLRGQEVYLRLPDGGARTRLTTAYFDTTLGVAGTMRNWRTASRLLELMQQRIPANG